VRLLNIDLRKLRLAGKGFLLS